MSTGRAGGRRARCRARTRSPAFSITRREATLCGSVNAIRRSSSSVSKPTSTDASASSVASPSPQRSGIDRPSRPRPRLAADRVRVLQAAATERARRSRGRAAARGRSRSAPSARASPRAWARTSDARRRFLARVQRRDDPRVAQQRRELCRVLGPDPLVDEPSALEALGGDRDHGRGLGLGGLGARPPAASAESLPAHELRLAALGERDLDRVEVARDHRLREDRARLVAQQPDRVARRDVGERQQREPRRRARRSPRRAAVECPVSAARSRSSSANVASWISTSARGRRPAAPRTAWCRPRRRACAPAAAARAPARA